MKRISILFFAIFLFSNFCLADVFDNKKDLSYITKQIPEMDSIKCKFKQEKRLKNIQKPIISGGDFEFKKNEGVYFYTTYPIQSTQNYTNKNYKQINDIINGISSKRYSKLEKEFEFYFDKNDENWTLGMKPQKESSVYNYIASIRIDGSNYIKKIVISQINGNETLLWFIK